MTETKAEVARDLKPLLADNTRLVWQCREWTAEVPMFGGVWGDGGRRLGSLCIHGGKGLHRVHYYVRDSATDVVLSIHSEKAAAIGFARSALKTLSTGDLAAAASQAARLIQDILDEKERKWQEGMAARREEYRREHPTQGPSVPKRRREVFNKSSGKCHYCGTTLTIDGKWHIEHMMPRALKGGSEMHNLVAACVPCNMRKKDKTDLEFQALIARDAASQAPSTETPQ